MFFEQFDLQVGFGLGRRRYGVK